MSKDTTEESSRPSGPPPVASGRLSAAQQWVLVGLLGLCVLAFPIAILLWPPTVLAYRDAFLGLAMIPGLLLGITGLWMAFGGRT